MNLRKEFCYLTALMVLVGAVLGLCRNSLLAQDQPRVQAPDVKEHGKPEMPPDLGMPPPGTGRLYVFREVRPYGAHIGHYVTVNGVPVQRLGAGSGFYCDVAAGDYVVGIAGHESDALKVTVTAGQWQYLRVSMRVQGAVAPKSGAMNSDQSFNVRLLAQDYGAQRAHEFHLSRASCQP